MNSSSRIFFFYTVYLINEKTSEVVIAYEKTIFMTLIINVIKICNNIISRLLLSL